MRHAPVSEPTRKLRITLRAERQEASNRPFASDPRGSPAGPGGIQRLAPQALSPCAARPAYGLVEDHTLHLRDSVPPSNRRYIATGCHREPVRADGQGSGCCRTSPEELPWNPLA